MTTNMMISKGSRITNLGENLTPNMIEKIAIEERVMKMEVPVRLFQTTNTNKNADLIGTNSDITVQ